MKCKERKNVLVYPCSHGSTQPEPTYARVPAAFQWHSVDWSKTENMNYSVTLQYTCLGLLVCDVCNKDTKYQLFNIFDKQ
jgi:hypothetical protein